MRGVKIQRLVNNPGIQLLIRLTMRAIKNNDQMKTDAVIYGKWLKALFFVTLQNFVFNKDFC